jgi:hypothetical protein
MIDIVALKLIKTRIEEEEFRVPCLKSLKSLKSLKFEEFRVPCFVFRVPRFLVQ